MMACRSRFPPHLAPAAFRSGNIPVESLFSYRLALPTARPAASRRARRSRERASVCSRTHAARHHQISPVVFWLAHQYGEIDQLRSTSPPAPCRPTASHVARHAFINGTAARLGTCARPRAEWESGRGSPMAHPWAPRPDRRGRGPSEHRRPTRRRPHRPRVCE